MKKPHRRSPEPISNDSNLPNDSGSTRLNKYMARAGVASRRKADDLIEKGRVRVNDQVVREFWYQVQPGDRVEVNGKIISPRDALYILLNKPKGAVTTTDDERSRETVLDLISLTEQEKQGLFPVGRLDRDTTGVLLLTNDGDLAHRLMHPRYEIDKLYLVRTRVPVKPHEIDALKKGIELEDGPARADDIHYARPPDHHEIGIRLHEGRNRQIRRMLEALGHEVEHLERVNYAGLTTEGIRRGKWRRLFPHEVRKLRRMVRLK